MRLKLTQHIGLFSLTTYFSFPDSCPSPTPPPGPHEAILRDLNISVSTSFYCFTTHSKSEKKGLVTQSHPILWDPRDYSLPDSSVHGILQARILEWVAIASSKACHLRSPYCFPANICRLPDLFTLLHPTVIRSLSANWNVLHPCLFPPIFTLSSWLCFFFEKTEESESTCPQRCTRLDPALIAHSEILYKSFHLHILPLP